MPPLLALLRTRWLRVIALSTVVSALLAVYSLPAQAETPGIGISKPTATVSEGGTTDLFNVWLGTQPATSVTLSVVNSAATQLTASPLYLTFTDTNWNTAQTVTLTATNDTADDGDTTATITLSVLDGASDDAYDDIADATVAVSVTDNDTCGLTILESNGSTGVAETATTDTFTVALGAEPTNDVVVSELSGRGNVMRRIRDMGLDTELDDADARRIVQHVKDQEAKGFSYEGARASFDLVLRRALPNYEAPYELVDFMVIVENRRRSSFGTGWRKDGAEHPMLSEATVKVRIGDEVQHMAAEGDGPVGALDQALRKAIIGVYPAISAVRLTDYKVRVVNEGAGTGAVVRVVIESADDRDVWHTVGASQNILEASWLALTDSFEWWLFRNGIVQ